VQCIDSILNQTYKNIELVLVDDGSNDGSSEICDVYAHQDSRVKVIHQNNQGKVLARYNGVKALDDCEYATFVDSDDWIELDTYEKMSKYIDQDIDMIYFKIIRYWDDDYHYITPNNYEEGIYNKKQIEEKIYPTMIWNIQKDKNGLDPAMWNKITKKDILYDEMYISRNLQINYGDDVAVIYPLITKINSMVITDAPLYYHRHRKSNEIADYFLDNDYYKKLYNLYEYLTNRFNGDKVALRQIDYLYTSVVRDHLVIYGDKQLNVKALFPFDKVPVHKRIILYGASVLGQVYFRQINQINYGTIIAWVDKSYEAYENLGVKNPNCICGLDFDYVVLAVNMRETAVSIKENLMKMGVDENKIVWK
jgi:glycosyltransferase involved in cell wall biosynthesis